MCRCWAANGERPFLDHEWVFRLLGELEGTIDHLNRRWTSSVI